MLLALQIFAAKSEGSSIPQLTVPTISKRLLPIPPSKEQERIANQVESLLKYIDGIDENAASLENAISFAKQKILDLAIRGKLVPQDPKDEPASELLKKIKAEKEALIKSGKLKRDKHESFIFRGDDNCYHENVDGKRVDLTDMIPFDLPDSWEWVKLKNVLLPTGSKKPSGDFFTYIDIDAIDNVTNKITSPKFISVKNAPSRANREISLGDTLFSLVRPYLKNIAMVSEEYKNGIASTGFYICRPSSGIDKKFLFYSMTSYCVVNSINSHMKGDNSPSVRKEDIENQIVSLPPLAEQKRIVSQIEKMFSILETMHE